MKQKAYFYIAVLTPFIAMIYFEYTEKPDFDKVMKEKSWENPQSIEDIQGRRAGQSIYQEGPEKDEIYKVKYRDSYYKIARKYNIQDVQALIKYNNNMKLVPELEIRIPNKLVQK
ncbi:MAG: LysM peptidoglycan-binding domain-containing protein [Desulfobacterales bacterium]|nr:LysM peptidoglycan-binding domain-containing protein [Desulfobacterales bacterium]